MKVKELIEKLKKMPQDAEVFGYGHTDEGDHAIEKIQICTAQDEYWQMNEYYCQGDSEASYYLKHEHPEENEVVVLMDFSISDRLNKN
jgi:hypothetical protein